MFSECGLPRLVRIRPPDSHKAGEDTQDVAAPLRPSSRAGVINITPIRTKSLRWWREIDAPTAAAVAWRGIRERRAGVAGTGGEGRRARGDFPVARLSRGPVLGRLRGKGLTGLGDGLAGALSIGTSRLRPALSRTLR